MDERPIGVFDSGVGGLTVLHECLVSLPNEDFVYLGDHARLPYGPRPLPEIRRFAHQIGAYLQSQDVKLIVVACNTATSAALPALQASLAVPVVGVIAPEAAAAVRATRNRRIGLLATEATVAAGRYHTLVAALDAGVRLTAVACPRLVPLIEAGEQTADAVADYAQPIEKPAATPLSSAAPTTPSSDRSSSASSAAMSSSSSRPTRRRARSPRRSPARGSPTRAARR